jgi:dTDP-4-amino-4,6-dideoxygalactose transaminase
MPVHVFGNPCDVFAIEKIAEMHNLKVIYDAAHAIGSTIKNKSVLEFGDISATSLHATKLLNTAEGGGCISNNIEYHRKLQRIRFFGHSDDKTDIVEDGFNGKLTEVHAALGIANLKYYDAVLKDRKKKYNLYIELLQDNSKLTFQKIAHGETNFSYFPVVFETEELLLKTMEKLNANNYFPRRYFWPSVNTFKKVVKYKQMPVSENISQRILCLPLYFHLRDIEIMEIANIINN